MNTITSTLTHKIIPPYARTSARPPALIMLHGRGANENDLLGLSEFLDERLFFIAPRAPFDFQFGAGFTWYNILEIGKPEPVMFGESYRRLSEFIEDVKKGYPVDPGRIFLLGFSMGTIMSFALALTQPGVVRGVVANSGYIPEDTDLTFQWDKLAGTSFFVAHGIDDPVIPVSYGRRAKFLLEHAGADFIYREYEMVHQIGEESLNDIAKWLSKMLGR